MTQILNKTLTFAEFANWIPEDKRYELHDGVVIELAQPIGKHENIFAFISRKINVQVVQLKSFPELKLAANQIFESAHQ